VVYHPYYVVTLKDMKDWTEIIKLSLSATAAFDSNRRKAAALLLLRVETLPADNRFPL